MVTIHNATMELRFKKIGAKVSFDIHAPPSKPQIFLQQKFMVQLFDANQKEDMIIPNGVNVQDVIPPKLMPHVESIGQVPEGMHVKIPKFVAAKIQWLNIPSATENDPDEINLPMPN